MEKIEYKKGDKAICKNCGKKIYLSGHDVWYHCNDDRDICNANKSIDFKHLFDKAEPKLKKEGRNSSQA